MSTEAVATILATLVIITGVLVYLAKKQFDSILNGIEQNHKDLAAETGKLAETISGVASKSAADVKEVEKQLNELKADMPHVYVLREDYLRTMNSVERKIDNIDAKLDKILEK